MSDSDVLLVNLDTGETIEADHYALVERGLPEGYVEAHLLTPREWIKALRKALSS